MTMPEKRIFAKAGHICMICGFRARTKNKYRELQDHLVRQHFQDRIKASLPTRRPFMCPDKSCTVEGKDWQALMRHYTGKHGILEAYLKEVLASGLLNNKENYVHRGHPSKLQMNRGPRIPMPSRRKKRPSTTSSEGSSSSSTAGKDVATAIHSTMTESDADGDPKTDLLDPRQFVSHGDDMVSSLCGHVDENAYHTLEVDDTELAEFPTHLALVMKRPKIGKNGEVEPDSLEETYTFVDLKCFMPISANRYIMKSHVNLDEPGMSFTLPNFPLNPAFMGENDPSIGYCCTNGDPNAENLATGAVDMSTTYFDGTDQTALHQEAVILNGDVNGLERPQVTSNGLMLSHMPGQYISSQMQYTTTHTNCQPTLIQSYAPMSMADTVPQPFGHLAFDCNSTTFCAVTTATTSSPTVSCTHDQVVPTVSTTDSPSPAALQDHSPIHVSDQSQIVLPCPIGCEDHTMSPQEGHVALIQQRGQQGHQEQPQDAPRQPILCPPAPVPVSVHLPTTIASNLNGNILSVSTTRADGSSKVIVEAAKTIPIEAQSDLQHLQHQPANANNSTNLEGMKEIDFSMF